MNSLGFEVSYEPAWELQHGRFVQEGLRVTVAWKAVLSNASEVKESTSASNASSAFDLSVHAGVKAET